MWIKGLEIDGFGRLRDIDVLFDERLTVVTGLNESGKSTLHAAILAALFGFFDSADLRKERVGLEQRDRYQPWDGGRYALKATVGRTTGPTVVVQWDFSGRTKFRANDAVTGEDLTSSFRGGAESVLSPRALAGVSREFFTRACFIRQGELWALEDPDRTIAKTIESMASSGGRDASAQRALVLIDHAYREEIGTDAARVRPLPRARQKREELEWNLEQAIQERADLEGLAVETTTATQEASALEEELAVKTGVLDDRTLKDLEVRVDDAQGASKQIAQFTKRLDELDAVAGFSTRDETEIGGADSVRRETIDKLEAARAEVELNKEVVSRLRNELRTGEEELATLAPYARGPEPSDVEQLAGALGRAEGAIPPAGVAIPIPDPPTQLLELEAQAESERSMWERLSGQASQRPRPVGAWVLAAGGGVAGAVVAFSLDVAPVAVILLIGAALATLGWLRARRTSETDGTGVSRQLREIESRRSKAADQRAAYENDVAKLKGQIEERERQMHQARELQHAALTESDEILIAAGYNASDRQAAVAQFKHAAERRTHRLAVEARVEGLRGELAERTKPELECARLENLLRSTKLKLVSGYERSGIDEEDLDRAHEIYEQKLSDRARYEEALNEKRRYEARLTGLLSSRTLNDIQLEAAALKARGAQAARVDPAASVTELEQEIRFLEKDGREAREQASNLSGQLSRALEALPQPAVLEEELARVQEEVADLEEAKGALLLAHEVLEQAAEETYSDIAPRLNEALGKSLGRVTGGRYTSVYADQDFNVRLESAEAGRIVEADSLSDGTQDQIYLIERLELVRILAGAEPLPMLLDDPLVHCDTPRRRALAALFGEVSARQQLIILSTDIAVAELLSEVCEHCLVIDLDALKQSTVGDSG